MAEYQGWYLDINAHPKKGIVFWMICEDGQRRQFRQRFPVSFYATGERHRLRQFWRYLRRRFPQLVHLSLEHKHDLFAGEMEVVRVEIEQPSRLSYIFFQTLRQFPDLDFYNTDIPLALRFAAPHKLYPLAYCRVVTHIDDSGEEYILTIEVLEEFKDITIEPPPIRILTLEPDVDPSYAPPFYVKTRFGSHSQRVTVEKNPLFLQRINSAIERHNPDLILTKWGDTWLFPLLFEIAERYKLEFNPNRGDDSGVIQRKAFSYHTYGRILHRGHQVHLKGRWHIDEMNAVMYGDYELLGVLEQAQVTGQPVQETARKSPGAGITAMQIISALQRGILVPYRKQQVEDYKTPRQMIIADRGGLVGQPQVGLHHNVGGIDFFSMYPQLMKRFNISPETVGRDHEGPNAEHIPGLGTPIDQSRVGFVGETLFPLLARRYVIKQELRKLTPNDYRYNVLKARTSALKWLLVVCFGYLGHKHFRWMRVEAYEAVTAFGREVLMRAKETAEEMGFRVLYFNVDGLYVKKPGADKPEDFKPLLKEIEKRTKMPIDLDGIFRWMVFLPSRTDKRAPVANRNFGDFQARRIRERGIEMRRYDTPPFVYRAQADTLRRLADALDNVPEEELITEILDMMRLRVSQLRAGLIPVEDLLVTQRLSRAPSEYKVPSPGGKAAKQLEMLGKDMQPGMRVQFMFTHTELGVTAWQAGHPLHIDTIDTERYIRLLVRAVHNIISVFGIDEELIREQLSGQLWLLPYLWQKEKVVEDMLTVESERG